MQKIENAEKSLDSQKKDKVGNVSINMEENGYALWKKIEEMKLTQMMKNIIINYMAIQKGNEDWILRLEKNLKKEEMGSKYSSHLIVEKSMTIKKKQFEDALNEIRPEDMIREASDMNNYNIYLSILRTFIMSFCYCITLPVTKAYMDRCKSDSDLAGTVLGLNSISQVLTAFLLNPWTNYQYKLPALLLSLVVAISFFLYVIAGYMQSAVFIMMARFLLGVGTGKVVSRRYLLQYAPKHKVRQYSLSYAAYTSLGNCFGPVFCYLLSFFPEKDFFNGFVSFNSMTNPGWFAFLLMAIYCLLVIFFYTDPYKPGFYQYRDEEEASKKESKKAKGKDGAFVAGSINQSKELEDIKKSEQKTSLNKEPLLDKSGKETALAEKEKPKQGVRKLSSVRSKPSLKKAVSIVIVFILLYCLSRITSEVFIISVPYIAEDNFKTKDSQLLFNTVLNSAAYFMG